MVCQSRNMDLCFIDVSFLFGLRTGMVGDKDGGGAFKMTSQERSTREVKNYKQILVIKSSNKSSTKGVLSAQLLVST